MSTTGECCGASTGVGDDGDVTGSPRAVSLHVDPGGRRTKPGWGFSTRTSGAVELGTDCSWTAPRCRSGFPRAVAVRRDRSAVRSTGRCCVVRRSGADDLRSDLRQLRVSRHCARATRPREPLKVATTISPRGEPDSDDRGLTNAPATAPHYYASPPTDRKGEGGGPNPSREEGPARAGPSCCPVSLTGQRNREFHSSM